MSIKSTLLGALAGIVTVFFAYFKGGQAAKNKIKAETEAEAREYERAGYDALIGGLEKEKKISDRPVEK